MFTRISITTDISCLVKDQEGEEDPLSRGNAMSGEGEKGQIRMGRLNRECHIRGGYRRESGEGHSGLSV